MLLKVSLAVKKLFNLMKCHLIVFAFAAFTSGIRLKKKQQLLPRSVWKSLHLFSPTSLMVLGLVSLDPYQYSWRLVLLFSFYSWWNWSTGRLMSIYSTSKLWLRSLHIYNVGHCDMCAMIVWCDLHNFVTFSQD